MTIFDLDYARQLMAQNHKPRKLFNTPDDIQSRIDAILNGGQMQQAKSKVYKAVDTTSRQKYPTLLNASRLKRVGSIT